ncbi:MAG: thioredoxin family protein [Desulfomicrobium sp.]|jgi:small redox-active disulfide protein 2|nr:thioredoxin family protein [Desulfomicrobium sp.]
MEIKVLGPGCAQCAQTEKLVREVVATKGGNIVVQKVSDFKEMMAAGVMSTPAVVIDGVVKCTGRIPSKEEISTWIENAGNEGGSD